MKLTAEQKAKIFAQYYNQFVSIEPKFSKKPSVLTGFDLETSLDDNYLLLSSLKNISDEDAIQVAKMSGEHHPLVKSGKILIESDIVGKSVWQYLIQSGYWIDYYDASTGITVTEEMAIQEGLIKIKS